jgi:NADPH-dependent curcumin reductase CurA
VVANRRVKAGWLQEGLLLPQEDIREGLENFPQILPELFSGQNFGKLILKVGEL